MRDEERARACDLALDVLSGSAALRLPQKEILQTIRKRWDSIAKPLDSLGTFEKLHARIGAAQGLVQPDLTHSAIFVLCADNGVVCEGISQSPQSVTALCAENIAAGKSCLSPLARRAGAAVEVFDFGMAGEKVPGVRNLRAADGTRDILKEPAMTAEEMLFSIGTGIHLVKEARERGYRILGTGEMGIGNTTTSAACLSALLHLPVSDTVGRGAGLSDDGLLQKRKVVAGALARCHLSADNPAAILQTLGGFDIAGMAGIFLGGAVYGVPVVMDGLISQTAALFAARFRPESKEFMIPSHRSRQPGGDRIMRELGLAPVLDAGMALGEGTGAALMLELLQSADAVYRGAGTFDSYKLEPYLRREETVSPVRREETVSLVRREETVSPAYCRPQDIERHSFEIIEEELRQQGIVIPKKERPVTMRVIHTTADFSYVQSLVYSKDAVDRALELLYGGCDIVTDTNMARSGISKGTLARLGGKVHCFMADPDVAREAKARGTTRAAVSMERAAGLKKDCIFAIGNAPTALITLYDLIRTKNFHPAFLIGVPVGFVNVESAKELFLDARDIPPVDFIINRGRKGGSTVAAAICNALIYEAAGRGRK